MLELKYILIKQNVFFFFYIEEEETNIQTDLY